MQLPMSNLLTTDARTKQQEQALLHGIERLYFIAKYADAMEVVIQALEQDYHEDVQKILLDYQRRCTAKIQLGKVPRNSSKE
jgi:hypothetical protein